MHELSAIAGLLFAAALTPGPNNLVVLREAGRDGVHGALPAIAGIVLGGLVLLCVVVAGAGQLLGHHAALREGITVAGGLYLAWLGLRLMAAARHRVPASPGLTLPAGGWGLFGFQFLNPKGWAMVLTVVAAWPAARLSDYLPLAGLFTAIPFACLLLWAGGGTLLAPHLTREGFRRRVDTAMGALLLASASLLFIDL
jgi:threonine/homoserine/homoserine lactone efflux protein